MAGIGCRSYFRDVWQWWCIVRQYRCLFPKGSRVTVTSQMCFLGCFRSSGIRRKNTCHEPVDTANGFLHFLLMHPLPIQRRLELSGVGIRE